MTIPRTIRYFGWLAVLPSVLTASSAAEWEKMPVVACAAIAATAPGLRASYRGRIANGDYSLVLEVPSGLVGWGAAMVAPFHGFTIPLTEPSASGGCISFYITRRVALNEDDEPVGSSHRTGSRVAVGNILGRRRERTGRLGGEIVRNIMIQFSYVRSQETIDGEIWLITPEHNAAANEEILRAFLSKMRFGGGVALPQANVAPQSRRLSSEQARDLVLAALGTRATLPKFGLDPYPVAHHPDYFFFEATWANPSPGSAVLGHYAVDPVCLDVWDVSACKRIDSAALRKLRGRLPQESGRSPGACPQRREPRHRPCAL